MTNEPTIIEMDEAIALFMGMRLEETYPNGYIEHEWVPSFAHSNWCFKEPPPFDRSWSWLMPVVEKIAVLDGGKYNFHISSTGQWACYISRDDVFDSEICSYGGFEPMILNVFKAAYQFITWLNQQKQKDGQ